MKRTLYTLSVLLIVIAFSFENSNAQPVQYTYARPIWTVAFGPVWNLATNDAYGHIKSNVVRDNYGMRWGWGGFLEGKYSTGKMRNDRLFLGVDYKGMTSTLNFGTSGANTKYGIVTIGAGYEYLFYGTYGFRSYYGAGFTGNFISGDFTPNTTSDTSIYARTYESSFRVGLEIKAGLEFVINNKNKNLGITVAGKYNLINLFNDNNTAITRGQPESLNDGDEKPGPGFKRNIGIVSLNIGLTIYPDVKRIVRK